MFPNVGRLWHTFGLFADVFISCSADRINCKYVNCKPTLELGEFACLRCLQTPQWWGLTCKQANVYLPPSPLNSYGKGPHTFAIYLTTVHMGKFTPGEHSPPEKCCTSARAAEWPVPADYFPSGKN